jgi:hypothetical protein
MEREYADIFEHGRIATRSRHTDGVYLRMRVRADPEGTMPGHSSWATVWGITARSDGLVLGITRVDNQSPVRGTKRRGTGVDPGEGVVKRQMDLPPGPLPLSYPPRVETEMTSPTEIPDWAKPPEDDSSQPTTEPDWRQEESPSASSDTSEWEQLIDSLLIE